MAYMNTNAQYSPGYNTYDDGLGGGPISVKIIRKCHIACASCDGQSNPDYNCQTCNAPNYHWADIDRCFGYCPSHAIADASTNYGYDSDSRGQYIDISLTNECSMCSVQCSFCDGPLSTQCYSCRAGYNLVDDVATCNTLFSDASANPPDYTCYDHLCQSGCPTHYYYA